MSCLDSHKVDVTGLCVACTSSLNTDAQLISKNKNTRPSAEGGVPLRPSGMQVCTYTAI
jgi:hypothetical protein